MFPLTKFPAGGAAGAAAAAGRRAVRRPAVVLQHGGGLPVRDLLVLVVWAVAAIALAVRTFRWE